MCERRDDLMDTLIKACVSSASYFISNTAPLPPRDNDMVEGTGMRSSGSSPLSNLHPPIVGSSPMFSLCSPYNYPRLRPCSPPVSSTIFSNSSASALTVSTSHTSPTNFSTTSTASSPSTVMTPHPNPSHDVDTPPVDSVQSPPEVDNTQSNHIVDIALQNYPAGKDGSSSPLSQEVDCNSNAQPKDSSLSFNTSSIVTTPLLPPPEAPSEERRWIRPLGYAERFMTNAHDFGCMTTVYSLWLEARQPIHFQTIKKTACIMYRKMPNLRMCVGKKDGALWWREMEKEHVDVEALKTDDVIKTFELLLRKRYRLDEGPLWFVRLVTLKEDESLDHDNNHNLKYRYVCIFGFHHNVSDGTTNMKFCKVFLSILNNLLQGKGIDYRQEGVFALPLHDKLANECTSNLFLFKLFLKRFYKGILSYGAYVRNFTRYYPMPAAVEARTHVMHQELDEVTTSKLLKRCKMEGVTLNSAFTAAANLGLYSLILKKTNNIKHTNFDMVHAVNMRRYWPRDARNDTFGCHISMLDMTVPTDIEDMDNFWEYTRKVHRIIQYELNDTKKALKVQPISERLRLIICSNSWLAWAGLPSTNDNHYCVTNMGDLSSTFPGTGEEVEVSRVVRSVSCHFMPTLCQHTLQTFRGKFCYSLDYYGQKLTPEVAKAYVDELIGLLKNRIHTPN